MTIHLSHAGKRFNRDWIFRKVSLNWEAGNAYAVVGPNGSGKSTLLQVLAANMQANEGKVEWQNKGAAISENAIFQHLSICAPYLEVIEEMTAVEFLSFHQSFKPFLAGVSLREMIDIVGLGKAADKQIRYYSSGMKQRIKLAQAIFSNAPLLLLDEPCTNLDATGYSLYHQLIENYCKEKLVVVSSNDVNEFDFCNERLSIMDFK